MLKIYFDNVLIDDSNYAELKNDFKLFDQEFYLGASTSNSFNLTIPASAISEIPKKVVIEKDNVTYATLIVDDYEYKDNNMIELSLVDQMVDLNKPYDASSIVPCTTGDIYNNIIETFGLESDVESFVNDDIPVNYYDNTISGLEYMQYLAELNGGYSQIDSLGKHVFKDFEDSLVRINIEDCSNIKIGQKHTIERVVFDNGILVFKKARPSRNIIRTDLSDWESGDYAYANGEKIVSNKRLRIKNLIEVQPSTSYYAKIELLDLVLREFDSNGDFIRSIGGLSCRTNGKVFTTSENAKHISVAIHDAPTSGEYTGYSYYEHYWDDFKPYICLNSETNKNYESYYLSEDVTLETLYLNSNNVYINTEEVFNKIANKILGFEFYSVAVDYCPINSSVRAGDVITFYDDDGNEYPTIAQYSLNFNGDWVGGYELDINSKQRQETQVKGPADKIKAIKVELDRNINRLRIEVAETNEKVDDLEESIELFSVDLSEDNLIIPTTADQKPYDTTTYPVNFYAYYKGTQVIPTVQITGSESGVTTTTSNSTINFAVANTNAIANKKYTYEATFTYSADNNVYTITKQISLTLATQGNPGQAGSRGTGVWTTTVAPTTPNYTFQISDLTGMTGDPIVGDVIIYSYYKYTITSVSSSSVLAGTRVSIRGATGASSKWYTGNKITGTSTTATIFPNSGISSAVVGDMYLNTETENTYRCTTAGNASTAKWVYTSNIKGEQGIPGADGTSTYFYVRYSANASGNPMTPTPQSDTQYMGVASTTSSTAPSSYSAYTWSKIKGEQGIQGQAGEDGLNSYLHIKWSQDGINFTPADVEQGIPEGKTPDKWQGTYVDNNPTDSTVFSDYNWVDTSIYVQDELNSLDGKISIVDGKIEDTNTNLSNNYYNRNQVDSTVNGLSGSIDGVLNRVVTLEQDKESFSINVKREIDYYGASKVVTSTGYVFDENGLNITKSGSEISNLVDNTGMFVRRDETEMLGIDATGGRMENLAVRKYLTMGTNSRFEDYKTSRTACFFVGGGN